MSFSQEFFAPSKKERKAREQGKVFLLEVPKATTFLRVPPAIFSRKWTFLFIKSCSSVKISLIPDCFLRAEINCQAGGRSERVFPSCASFGGVCVCDSHFQSQ